jgi:hypothetical protein
MKIARLALFAFGGVLGSLVIPACDFDVPDLNNPNLDDLENNPTSVSVGAACTGLLIGGRVNVAAANGYVSQLGILGREAYNFDSADPRYVGELIQGTLNAGSPFGGAVWIFPYRNLRLGSLVLGAVEKVADLAPEDKAAIRGFTKTIGAVDLLQVIVAHDTNGAVIDTGRGLDEPLAPIVSKEETYDKIVSLLEEGATDLKASGETFPFSLSEGYDGFDTPATFLTFNRAIRARVAIYRKDYTGALDALSMSFLAEPAGAAALDFDLGVYYSYSTRTGDTTNLLVNPNIFAHPTLETEAMMNGATIDNRYTRKVALAEKPGSVKGPPPRTSKIAFTKLYADPASPVPLIRNEELILIKAEALFFSNPADPVKVAAAVTELNLVRQKSGGLPALVGLPNATTFTNELLYERRYSLLFEGGHRWIDLRRFAKPLPLDNPTMDVANVRYPIPLQECNARPNEPACAKGSTDTP